MSEKRKSTDREAPAAKKHKSSSGVRKGITVGPANLPDGQWKRRNQRIKHSLVSKAKLRSEYHKLKTRAPAEEQKEANELRYYAQADQEAVEDRARARQARVEQEEEEDSDEGVRDADGSHANTTVIDTSNTPHPDRQAMMDREPSPPPMPVRDRNDERAERRQRRPKSVPFAKEQIMAEQRKQEAEERANRIKQAQQERAQKIEERERFRRAMAKARSGGKNGQRKLGRESGVLLEKVKRIMAEK